MKGYFVAIEGSDGAGKSTLAKSVCAALLDDKTLKPELITMARDPGNTPYGEALRQVAKAPQLARGLMAEALTFLAARRELCEVVIGPALDMPGQLVMTDRYELSTVVYQAIARGFNLKQFYKLMDAVEVYNPNQYIVLYGDPAVLHERTRRRGVADILAPGNVHGWAMLQEAINLEFLAQDTGVKGLSDEERADLDADLEMLQLGTVDDIMKNMKAAKDLEGKDELNELILLLRKYINTPAADGFENGSTLLRLLMRYPDMDFLYEAFKEELINDDRFEQDLKFMQNVNNAFTLSRALAPQAGCNIELIDTTDLTIEEVTDEAAKIVRNGYNEHQRNIAKRLG